MIRDTTSSINLATVTLLLSGWPRGLENKTDVALTIIASSSESGEREVQMQQEILRSVHDTSHLVMYPATFSLHGDDWCNNNNHRVLVGFPWRGTCLGDLITWEISMATRMSAARQLLGPCLGEPTQAGSVHRGMKERLLTLEQRLECMLIYTFLDLNDRCSSASPPEQES